MTRLRRHRTAVAALLCALLAAFAVLLALDARSWQRSVARDDLRFRAMHAHLALWRPSILLPGDPAQRLLGLDGPLLYRRAVQLFWYSRTGSDPDSRQDLPRTRAKAQQDLQAVLDSRAPAAARAEAANLIGVLVVTSPLVLDPQAQTQTLRRATVYFQQAIGLDSTYYDAKLNLEIVLRLRKPGKSKLNQDARGGYGFGRGRGVKVAGNGY